jgi:hypothetical protein
MVDIAGKIDVIIRDYIERGAYFVINRARQYGKTTTLGLLARRLSGQYLVFRASLEGSESFFVSHKTMAGGICRLLYNQLNRLKSVYADLFAQPIDDQFPMDDLSERITRLCEQSEQPIVLMIDEVDRASDYLIFASFLGMLRKKNLDRLDLGMRSTFHNVILAGVHDIKNLKARIRPDSEHAYNSPWNIAASFDVDMSFSVEEIDGMLRDYEADHQTGMDTYGLAQVIRGQTSGYPFLVSALCKRLDEVTHDWTAAGLHEAIAHLMCATNTLFDDIIKNLQTHEGFRRVIESMLIHGNRITYMPVEPAQNLGLMFGILRHVGNEARISNSIFEQYIFNYFIALEASKALIPSSETRPSIYVRDGRLDMRLVIERFAGFTKSERRPRREKLLEDDWRYLFLSYIRPIINGTGHYAEEPETRDNTRADIIVFYGKEEFVIELKLWRGQKQEEDAYNQLAGYLESRGQSRGYLVSFCGLRNPPQRGEWIKYGEYMIYEEIVPCSSGDGG